MCLDIVIASHSASLVALVRTDTIPLGGGRSSLTSIIEMKIMRQS